MIKEHVGGWVGWLGGGEGITRSGQEEIVHCRVGDLSEAQMNSHGNASSFDYSRALLGT